METKNERFEKLFQAAEKADKDHAGWWHSESAGLQEIRESLPSHAAYIFLADPETILALRDRLHWLEAELARASKAEDRLLASAEGIAVQGHWIEIKEGRKLPEVEQLVLILTKEPEIRLARLGGHKDTFWEHLHWGDWNIRDVELWAPAPPVANAAATTEELVEGKR